MKLHYQTFGDSNHQPFIIIHGFLGSLENWRTYGAKFSDNYFVNLIDLRNHGQSPRSEEFNYELMVEDLEEFINDHAIKKPILMGHSMGAKVVMNYANKNRDSVRKIILLDMAPKQYEAIQSKQIIDAINAINLKNYKNRFALKEYFKKKLKSNTLVNFIIKSISVEEEKLSWKFYLPAFNKNLENLKVAVTIAPPLEIPALFVKGGKSNFITQEDIPLIKKLFPPSHLEIIEDAGHWVHYEKGELLFYKIIDFLK